MSDRGKRVWPGCLMYKLDRSRGYRQLLLDSLHWLLMSIRHEEKNNMDVWPPFGLRTARSDDGADNNGRFLHSWFLWLSFLILY